MSANGCPPFPPFSLSATGDAGETVLAAHGELDLDSAEDLMRAVRRLWSAGVASVVVDLEPLDFLDSSGLRAVFALHEAGAHDNRGFALSAGPHVVQRIFELTDTRGLFHWR